MWYLRSLSFPGKVQLARSASEEASPKLVRENPGFSEMVKANLGCDELQAKASFNRAG